MMMKMNTKFSVVLPVHNEEQWLPYTLPSVYELEPNDVVLLFDRCTDNSYDVASLIAYYYDSSRTQFITFEENKEKHRLAWVRRRGYALARHNIILSTAADIILDPRILLSLSILKGDSNVALVSVGCKDYPVSPRNLVGNLAQKLMVKTGHPRFYGPFFFKRDKWLESEESLGVVSEDAPLWLSLLRKNGMRFVNSKCLHLRADESWKRNYDRGRDYWNVARRGLLFALAGSMFMARPSLLAGYVHERLNQ